MTQPTSVALVDADRDWSEACQTDFMRCPDFTVVGLAASAKEGVELYRRRRPDVMLVDPSIDGMAGVAAIAAICRKPSSACVVALTNVDSASMIVAALRAGASGYLLKACVADELTEGVHQAVGGHMPLSAGARLALVDAIRAGRDSAVSMATSFLPTRREAELIRWIAVGLTNKEIGEHMHVSEGSVKQYLNHIANKLGVRSRSQVLARSVRLNLVDLDVLPGDGDGRVQPR